MSKLWLLQKLPRFWPDFRFQKLLSHYVKIGVLFGHVIEIVINVDHWKC